MVESITHRNITDFGVEEFIRNILKNHCIWLKLKIIIYKIEKDIFR